MNYPKSNVSFATTKVFAEKFPQEVEEQNSKFTQPTWAQKLAPPKPDIGQDAYVATGYEKVVVGAAVVVLLLASSFIVYQYLCRQ